MFTKKTIALALSASTAVAINTHRIRSSNLKENKCEYVPKECRESCETGYKLQDAIKTNSTDQIKLHSAWFCTNHKTTGKCMIKSGKALEKYGSKMDENVVLEASIEIAKSTAAMCMCPQVQQEMESGSKEGKAWKGYCQPAPADCKYASSECMEVCQMGNRLQTAKKEQNMGMWFCDNHGITGKCMLESGKAIATYAGDMKKKDLLTATMGLIKATKGMCTCDSVKTEIENADSEEGQTWKKFC